MAAASAAQLEEIIEALRAVRDADTNLQGLKSFRRQLRQDGEAFLQAYLAAAPGFAELHRIWDHQHVVGRLQQMNSPNRASAVQFYVCTYVWMKYVHNWGDVC